MHRRYPHLLLVRVIIPSFSALVFIFSLAGVSQATPLQTISLSSSVVAADGTLQVTGANWPVAPANSTFSLQVTSQGGSFLVYQPSPKLNSNGTWSASFQPNSFPNSGLTRVSMTLGHYQISATETFSSGQSSSATASFTVDNVPIIYGSSESPQPGSTVCAGSVHLVASGKTSTPVQSFTFQATGSGVNKTLQPSVGGKDNLDPAISTSITLNPGTYTIRAVLTDALGVTGGDRWNITVKSCVTPTATTKPQPTATHTAVPASAPATTTTTATPVSAAQVPNQLPHTGGNNSSTANTAQIMKPFSWAWWLLLATAPTSLLAAGIVLWRLGRTQEV